MKIGRRVMIHLPWRAIRAWRHLRQGVGYSIVRFDEDGGFWVYVWTPVWAEGRGPYVSLGLGKFAVYRGY